MTLFLDIVNTSFRGQVEVVTEYPSSKINAETGKKKSQKKKIQKKFF